MSCGALLLSVLASRDVAIVVQIGRVPAGRVSRPVVGTGARASSRGFKVAPTGAGRGAFHQERPARARPEAPATEPHSPGRHFYCSSLLLSCDHKTFGMFHWVRSVIFFPWLNSPAPRYIAQHALGLFNAVVQHDRDGGLCFSFVFGVDGLRPCDMLWGSW